MEQAIILSGISLILLAIEEITKSIKYTAKQRTYDTLKGFKLSFEDIKQKPRRRGATRVSNPGITTV